MLPPCNPSFKYKHYFITAGPRPKEGDYRKVLEQVIARHWGNAIESMLIVQEVSDQGYHHFHVAVILKEEKRFVQLSNSIKKFVTSLGATDSASCRFNYVRKGEDPQLIRKYITNPTKVKSVDEESLEFEPTLPFDCPLENEGDRNFIEFLRVNHVCKQCKRPKPVFSRKCIVCV